MIALGIDPDTKATGIAIIEARPVAGRGSTVLEWDFKVLYVATAAVKASLPVQERIRHMSDNIDLELQNLPCYIGLVDPLEDLVTRIAVEGQRVYPSGKVRPQDLIHLAQVAGMAAAHAQQAFPMASLWIPEPVVWKGSVEKKAHQRRILRSVGLTEKLEGVEGAKGMTKTQRGHVVDAIGLALWVAQVPSRRKQR